MTHSLIGHRARSKTLPPGIDRPPSPSDKENMAPPSFNKIAGILRTSTLNNTNLTTAKTLYDQWEYNSKLTEQKADELFEKIKNLLILVVDGHQSTNVEIAEAQYYLGYLHFTLGYQKLMYDFISIAVEYFRAINPDAFTQIHSNLPDLHYIEQVTLIRIDLHANAIAPAWQNIMHNPQLRQALLESDPKISPVHIIESIATELLSWANAKGLINQWGYRFDIDDIYRSMSKYPEFEKIVKIIDATQIEAAPIHDGLFSLTYKQSQSLSEMALEIDENEITAPEYK